MGTDHNQKDCSNPMVCYICKNPGHVSGQCPDLRKKKRGLQICVSGAEGNMFYSLQVGIPKNFDMPTAVEGKFSVQKGVCSVEDMVKELQVLIEQPWEWRVKVLEEKTFLVEFPNLQARRSLTKFANGFCFVTDPFVQAIVTAMTGEFESFGELQEAWVKLFGLPSWSRTEEAVWDLAYMIAEPRAIDVEFLLGPGQTPERLKVGCQSVEEIDGHNEVYLNGKGFKLEWKVERSSVPSDSGPQDTKKRSVQLSKEDASLLEEDGGNHTKYASKEEQFSGQTSRCDGTGSSVNPKQVTEGVARSVVLPVAPEDGGAYLRPCSGLPEMSFTKHKYIGFPEKVAISEDADWSDEVDDEAKSKLAGQTDGGGAEGSQPVVTLFDTHKVSMKNLPKEMANHGMMPVAGKGWTTVAKKDKKTRSPVRATRQSQRFPKDGVPVQERAEKRAQHKDDLTGTLFNFTVLQDVPNSELSEVALDCKVVLGGSGEEIDACLDRFKAKELAEARLAVVRAELLQAASPPEVASGQSLEGSMHEEVAVNEQVVEETCGCSPL
ncbi:hypothetical protein BRADI_4g37921v3 [Brachypodium distachyon]|uniref:CCHC-type domain-containing protein n=1 Tax=Brachypodium distachyon TaxID=15368 RepID=A0A2K2CSY1_BRADI|nr:hypothetical protein BRADI_4g37921v3 [Brachypodium distachyon]